MSFEKTVALRARRYFEDKSGVRVNVHSFSYFTGLGCSKLG